MQKEIYEEIEGQFDTAFEKVKSYEPLNWEDRLIVSENIKSDVEEYSELIVKLIGGGSIYAHEFDFIYEIMKSRRS